MSVLLCSSCCDPVIALWLFKEGSRANPTLQAASLHSGSTFAGTTFGVMSEMLLPAEDLGNGCSVPRAEEPQWHWWEFGKGFVCYWGPSQGSHLVWCLTHCSVEQELGAAEGDFGDHLLVICLRAGNSILFQSDLWQPAFQVITAFDTNGWLLCPVPASLLQGWVMALQRSWALLPNGNCCWKEPGVPL